MEGKVGLRKIKQWYRWLQAEQWIKKVQISLEEKETQNHLTRKQSFFLCYTAVHTFPTKKQRGEALIEGWQVEVVPFKWWCILLKETPTLNKLFVKIKETPIEKKERYTFEQGGFWLITHFEGENVKKTVTPSFLDDKELNMQNIWTFWENRVWTYEQFKNHPSRQYTSQEMAINQIIHQTILNQTRLVQVQEQPTIGLVSCLEQYVQIKMEN
jgi:hypothetical protein